MRGVLRANPQTLQPFFTELGRQNPNLLQVDSPGNNGETMRGKGKGGGIHYVHTASKGLCRRRRM